MPVYISPYKELFETIKDTKRVDWTYLQMVWKNNRSIVPYDWALLFLAGNHNGYELAENAGEEAEVDFTGIVVGHHKTGG